MTNSNDVRGTGSVDIDQPVPLIDRLIWLCPILGLVAGAAVLWLFGLTLWTAILFALLVACPILLAWLLLREGRRHPAMRTTSHD